MSERELFSDSDFVVEIEQRVAEIIALDAEEAACDDLDDRIGVRHRRNDLERWLGHRIVRRAWDMANPPNTYV